MSAYKLLDLINNVSDLKKLKIDQLQLLASDIRKYIIDTISSIGGHIGGSLGVVELTIMLHYIFDSPKDKIIWDVGHQSYPHKILTGRKKKLQNVRKRQGISTFLSIKESEFDVFGAGHSSTSISAAMGIAVARNIKKENNDIIAVIGDGALSAGMAFEAINNLYKIQDKGIIVILNDNGMSISPSVGALDKHFKNINKDNIFTKLGLEYIGPIDGNDINQLHKVLTKVKGKHKNVVIHCKTVKGKGFNNNIDDYENFHAVGKFNKDTLEPILTNKKETYTDIAIKSLINIAETDNKVVAITAAMESGTGLNKFSKKFPDRYFDVGIAEQHAVTCAGGMAINGLKPYVAIYSTFLQRAYDQLLHDIAIQKLPVKFLIDRAGITGEDGPTHAGSFDISYLINIPNFIIMLPSDAQQLINMIYTSYFIDDNPCSIRYPKFTINSNYNINDAQKLPIGKGRIINQGNSDIAILSFGTCLEESKKILDDYPNITIADALFAKPLDVKLIENLVKQHKILITIEEGVQCGAGALVMNEINKLNLLDHIKIFNLTLPDKFIQHDTIQNIKSETNLDYPALLKLIDKITKDHNIKL